METEENINMFCLPSAGSSASIYRNWSQQIQDKIHIIPLEYPGHGRKIKEELISDPDQLTEILIQEIKCEPHKKFILFGHSVGASILWRIEQRLKYHNLYDNLLLLVISSRPSPIYLKKMKKYSELGHSDLIQELKLYNNFPEEILSNQNALDFFIKIIKNDFLLSDKMLNDPIAITSKPLMSVYGKDDPYLQNHNIMDSWKDFSTNWMGCYALEGDHFYFMKKEILQDTLKIIESNIEQLLSSSQPARN